MMRARCALVLVGLSFASTGCGDAGPDGPKRVPVTGTVTFDGASIDSGEIRFIPADGNGQVDAAEISGGQYSASVTPGTKRVEIMATREDRENMVPSGANPGEMEPSYVQYIPENYNTATTLTAEIKSDGDNDLPPFDLKSAGG